MSRASWIPRLSWNAVGTLAPSIRNTAYPWENGNVGLDRSRVLEYNTMIREELKELCDAAMAEDWGGFLLELTHILYLASHLAQKASLETVL